MMYFSKTLVEWYLQNKRDLPWRKTSDPYNIWLSEIMLQQTRVAQGLPYFLKFTEAFPTVFDLAEASEEKVLKLWQGLGYYSRARNMHATAKFIANDLKGRFPDNYKELVKLKGVGDYTAAAIASISYGEPVPVVDGNVYRVLSRFLGIRTDISSSQAKKEFTAAAASLLPAKDAAVFNQAIMEFGALQCVPKSPGCNICIFASKCVAFQTGTVGELPVKLKKAKVANRYFNYLIIKDGDGRSIIQKRTGKGIWHNLYEFPLIETEKSLAVNEGNKVIEKHTPFNLNPLSVRLLNTVDVVHKLSHQHLYIKFWEVKTDKKLPDSLAYNEIKAYPFPVVLYNFIEKHWE